MLAWYTGIRVKQRNRSANEKSSCSSCNELINGPVRVNECNNRGALCRVTIARSLNCFPQRAMHFSLWSAAGVDRSPDETSLVSSFRICSPLDNPGQEIVAQSSPASRNRTIFSLFFFQIIAKHSSRLQWFIHLSNLINLVA